MNIWNNDNRLDVLDNIITDIITGSKLTTDIDQLLAYGSVLFMFLDNFYIPQYLHNEQIETMLWEIGQTIKKSIKKDYFTKQDNPRDDYAAIKEFLGRTYKFENRKNQVGGRIEEIEIINKGKI